MSQLNHRTLAHTESSAATTIEVLFNELGKT